MSERGYKIRNQAGIHFITFAVVEWVDVFTRKDYKDILLDNLRFCQAERGLAVHSWCIMSNHVHLIVSAHKQDTSEILRDFKKFTSKAIIKAILEHPTESRKEWMLEIFRQAGAGNSRNSSYQFWRQDNQPKEIFNLAFSREKLSYIHNNPVEAGLVIKAEEYLYSSAKDYFEGKHVGLLRVEFLE
jgi:REP element-mobilizing transposase RayT